MARSLIVLAWSHALVHQSVGRFPLYDLVTVSAGAVLDTFWCVFALCEAPPRVQVYDRVLIGDVHKVL